MEHFLKIVEKYIKDFFRQRKNLFFPYFKNYEETYLIWYLVRDGIHPDWDITTSSSDFDICVALYYEAQHDNSPDKKFWPMIDEYYISAIKKESREAVSYYLEWNRETYMLTNDIYFKEKEISFLWQATIVKHKYLIELFKKKFMGLFHECCNGNSEYLTVFKNIFDHKFPLTGEAIRNDPTINSTIWKYINEGHHYYIPSYINMCDIESFIKLNEIDKTYLDLYRREIFSGRDKFLKQLAHSELYEDNRKKFTHLSDGIKALDEKIIKITGREYWRNKHRYNRNTDSDEFYDQIHDSYRSGTSIKNCNKKPMDNYVLTNYKDKKLFQKPIPHHLGNPMQSDIINLAEKMSR